MIVFLSWSGPLSKAVAELLVSWLPEVIQEVKPWISSQNIEKGSIWSGEIDKALSTTVGILCVTQSNKNAPWLLFEAGGLFKGLPEARVCPLLIDLERKDLEQPLARFQDTMPNKEDMGKLLTTINNADPEKALPKERLQNSFNRMWPEFEERFQELLRRHAEGGKPGRRTPEEMIVEILEISRALQRNSEQLLQLSSEPVAATIEGGYSGYSGYSGYGRGRRFYFMPEPNRGLQLYSEMVEKAEKERAEKERAKEKPPEKSG